jgi:hypothetical protein
MQHLQKKSDAAMPTKPNRNKSHPHYVTALKEELTCVYIACIYQEKKDQWPHRRTIVELYIVE